MPLRDYLLKRACGVPTALRLPHNQQRVRKWAAVAATIMIIGVTRRPGFAAWQAPAGPSLPVYGYTIVHTYPHDRDAFTEGLFYLDGFLYEGTGLEGRSSIRKVKLETGEVVQRHDIDAKYFGEGIVTWGSELFELTYTSGIGFVYDRQTLVQKRTFRYTGEGWAFTKDAHGLIMTDGTDALRFLDPVTLAERRPRLKVTADGKPLKNINELEYVKGEILSNVWQTDYLARINPDTGKVTGWVDLRGLLTPRESASADVLNGIAYDEKDDRLFVTGKFWPKLFEIKLVAKGR
jgi:glutamine cyclotransferase